MRGPTTPPWNRPAAPRRPGLVRLAAAWLASVSAGVMIWAAARGLEPALRWGTLRARDVILAAWRLRAWAAEQHR